uniref:Uncharacterized protein n=1 Tax=Glossina pallidipes TaxID=7398 RepID=A0A1A9ZTT5_GLOPL
MQRTTHRIMIAITLIEQTRLTTPYGKLCIRPSERPTASQQFMRALLDSSLPEPRVHEATIALQPNGSHPHKEAQPPDYAIPKLGRWVRNGLPYDNRAPLLEPTKANNTRHLRIKRPVFKCVINDDSDDNDSDKLEYLWDGAILNVTEFKLCRNKTIQVSTLFANILKFFEIKSTECLQTLTNKEEDEEFVLGKGQSLIEF